MNTLERTRAIGRLLQSIEPISGERENTGPGMHIRSNQGGREGRYAFASLYEETGDKRQTKAVVFLEDEILGTSKQVGMTLIEVGDGIDSSITIQVGQRNSKGVPETFYRTRTDERAINMAKTIVEEATVILS